MSGVLGAQDTTTPAGSLARLLRGIDDGNASTVRVCFSDHYGVLRGRRVVADLFAAEPSRQGFCDGALVWDIRCEIFEETDFSNYRTGYPDLYVEPELGTLRPCQWTDGEWIVLGDCRDEHGQPLDVDPRASLRRVLAKAAVEAVVRIRLELQAPGLASDRGERLLAALVNAARGLGLGDVDARHDTGSEIIALDLPALPALPAGDATVLLRSAAREISRAHGADVSAMAQAGPDGPATRIVIGLEGAVPDPDGAKARAEELSLLLRPLPAGALGLAGSAPSGPDFAVAAASDANPYLASAAAIAAAAEDASAPAAVVSRSTGDDLYGAAIANLGWSEWAGNWFTPTLIHDAIAIAEREASICADGRGPWDRDRYWECG